MRGRPAWRMTTRRKQILDRIMESGEQISFARLARECGLYDYREARRIVTDLKKMRAI